MACVVVMVALALVSVVVVVVVVVDCGVACCSSREWFLWMVWVVVWL